MAARFVEVGPYGEGFRKMPTGCVPGCDFLAICFEECFDNLGSPFLMHLRSEQINASFINIRSNLMLMCREIKAHNGSLAAISRQASLTQRISEVVIAVYFHLLEADILRSVGIAC